MGFPTGEKHYRWNRNSLRSSHGYTKIRVGKDHPLSDPIGYAYEHLLVWCSAGNPKPLKNELIHHKNGDMTDNRIENLALTSRSDHNKYHNEGRKRDDKGRFVGTKKAGRLLDGREWNGGQDAKE